MYGGEYEKEDPKVADLKCKGRRVRFSNVEVVEMDRTKDGRTFVAPLSVPLAAPSAPAGTGGPGGHAPQRAPAPCYYFFVSEAESAKVKVGATYEITGTCLGHQKDNLWRGGVPGMDWHVDFEDCTVAPAQAGK
jgi:hypothetical protein